MNAQEFAYWLQGFFEMTDAKELTPDQVEMIKEHLGLVFEKKTEKVIKADDALAKAIEEAVKRTKDVPFDDHRPPHRPWVTPKVTWQPNTITCGNGARIC